MKNNISLNQSDVWKVIFNRMLFWYQNTVFLIIFIIQVFVKRMYIGTKPLTKVAKRKAKCYKVMRCYFHVELQVDVSNNFEFYSFNNLRLILIFSFHSSNYSIIISIINIHLKYRVSNHLMLNF